MFGSSIIEVAAGLVFIYLLISLMASAISGKISEILLWRAKFLERGLRELVLGEDSKLNKDFAAQITTQFYNHPSIRSLYDDKSTITRWLENSRMMGTMKEYVKDAEHWVPPGKIDGKTFSLALLDLVMPSSEKANDFEMLRNTLKTAGPLQGTQIQQTLLTLINNTDNTITGARQNIEEWFDSVMVQITNLYTKRMRLISFFIGLSVALILNVDTISVTNALWRNPTLRDSVSQAAAKFEPQKDEKGNPVLPIDQINQQLAQLTLPIGWSSCPTCANNIAGIYPTDWLSGTPSAPVIDPSKSGTYFVGALLLKILGFLASGLAAAQGSTFWYDVLKKVTSRN